MNTKPVIETMTGADLFAAIELEAEIFSESDRWTHSMLAEELTLPNRLYLGAYANKQLIAMIGVRLGIDAELMTIGVHPAWRGRGLATRLLQEMLDTLTRVRLITGEHIFIAEADWRPPKPTGGIEKPIRRVERIILEVRASNAPAIKLYESHGFKQVSKIPRYYHRPEEDALIMDRALTGV
ncbi:MAG: GNAT family N-acetyltransferase [Actinomycetaceae bacterium]|nr:GNAT family N-acetyltransferase [Actinomycetaceae bacterium]